MDKWRECMLGFFADRWNDAAPNVTLYLVGGHVVTGMLDYSEYQLSTPDDTNPQLTGEDILNIKKSGRIDLMVGGSEFSTHVDLVVGYSTF